jgi:hypothetical protein
VLVPYLFSRDEPPPPEAIAFMLVETIVTRSPTRLSNHSNHSRERPFSCLSLTCFRCQRARLLLVKDINVLNCCPPVRVPMSVTV